MEFQTTVDKYTYIYTGAGTQITPATIGGYTQSTTAVSSVKSAIENPMTFYYESVTNWTWYKFNDISLWSDYSINSKSIYDPCPYGYRVPRSGEGAASSWNGFTHAKDTAVDLTNGEAWNGTWWPIAGSRGGADGVLYSVGGYAYYWSSSRHSNAYRSYYLTFDYNGTVYPSGYYYRSYGFSVRCVQEEPQSAELYKNKQVNKKFCYFTLKLSENEIIFSIFVTTYNSTRCNTNKQ